jgi:hypothetical protein
MELNWFICSRGTLIFNLAGKLPLLLCVVERGKADDRMVIAGLLGLHHRVDWKECSGSEAEEKEDAQKFRKAFAPFQPKK